VRLFPFNLCKKNFNEEHRLSVFENGVLRRIFGPKGEEVAGGWRRLHHEELHNLYALRNIITVMKPRRMRWLGRVVRRGEMRNAFKFLSENVKGRHHSEDLTIDGKVILEWILGNRVGRCGTSAWLRIGTSGGCCDHGNESWVSIKGGEFLNKLSDY
jgi:hypothetical protein